MGWGGPGLSGVGWPGAEWGGSGLSGVGWPGAEWGGVVWGCMARGCVSAAR